MENNLNKKEPAGTINGVSQDIHENRPAPGTMAADNTKAKTRVPSSTPVSAPGAPAKPGRPI